MQYSNIQKYIQQAFDKGEIDLLITGAGEYHISYPPSFNIPLEVQNYQIVAEEVSKYLDESSSDDDLKKFKNALIKQAADKPFSTWAVFQLFEEWERLWRNHKINNSLGTEVRNAIKNGIRKNSDLKNVRLFLPHTGQEKLCTETGLPFL